MNYHNITKEDMKNGDGLRVVLWVAGCEHHCKGCQNPITWNVLDGIKFDQSAKEEIYNELQKPYISGITFSGGDPLHIANREEVTLLAQEIKEKFPNKTIWLYTGYNYEDIRYLPLLKYVDVLCDGKFVLEERNVNLPWVGSNNQRVINIPETLKNNTICLHITKDPQNNQTTTKCSCSC